MNINSFNDNEKNKLNNRSTNISNTNPNSNIELMLGRDVEDVFKYLTENENKEIDKKEINIKKKENLIKNYFNNYENHISENSNSKKDNTNYIESKKSVSQDKSERNDLELSLSQIEFEYERDYKFYTFMYYKKYNLRHEYDLEDNLCFDTNKEDICIFDENKKIKCRIFMEQNKISVFNSQTNFLSKNSKHFPILNLDFDFLTSNFLMDIENLILRICIVGHDKVFKFQISNKKFYNIFSCRLNLIIQNSEGYKKCLVSVCLRKDFYKVNFLNVKVIVLLYFRRKFYKKSKNR